MPLKPRLLVMALVFWPWLIIVLELIVIWLATAWGCTISSRGPETCMVLGHDIGERLYPLWSVGFQLVYSLFWVVPGIILWVAIEIIAAKRKQNS